MPERRYGRYRGIKRKLTRTEVDQTYDTEAGYEWTPATPVTLSRRSASDREESYRNHFSGIGFLASLFAILSLFFTPIIMGPTSAALGAIAYVQGSRYAGTFAIVLGVAAFVIRLLAVVM